ncbi:hypothetical protein L195_g031136 [Trifolium pratense]|uniref:Uncharacterized protein n=1 Tax=Trifolium pratense TaxID=57577 RepID=A0A2K3L9L1_TRIPR|nr:hypothetical protein L195_g031136 [Trifolium pratense]
MTVAPVVPFLIATDPQMLGLNIMEVGGGTMKGDNRDEERRKTHIDGRRTSTRERTNSISKRINSYGKGGIPTRGGATLNYCKTKNSNF